MRKLTVILIPLLLTGCVSVKAPERVSVGSDNRAGHVDASHVPPTRDHRDARQKLAHAHARIRELEEEVADLEKDKRDLKRELDRYDD